MKKCLSIALACILVLGMAVPAFALNGHVMDAQHPATISAGDGHSAAIMADGSLWMWGRNDYGQLGNGGTAMQPKPVKVMDGAASVSCGQWITAAVKEDSSLWEWGWWNYERHTSPARKAEDVKAAAYPSSASRQMIKTDGSLWWEGSYRTGSGYGESLQSTPVKILDGVVSGSFSNNTFALHQKAAVKADGTLWLWGGSWDSILAEEQKNDYLKPIQYMDNVRCVSCSHLTTGIVKADGTLWMFGNNSSGQVGNGSRTDVQSPVRIMDQVSFVQCGDRASAAIKTDGSLWMWGDSNMLGNGGKGNLDINASPREDDHVWIQTVPVKVMDDVAQVTLGTTHVLALKKDGSVWAWGRNSFGCLGNGSTAADVQLTPVRILTGALVPGATPPKEEPSAWAKALVEKAIAQGLVPTSLQGKYKQTVTRLEFCTLACRFYETLNGEVNGRKIFSDTTDPNVEKMAALGVVAGVGNGRFDPDAQLTREQAASMLSSLAKAMGKPIEESEPVFADADRISDWALGFVGQMQKSGIMNGTGNDNFSPAGSYTCEQSICTMMNMLDYLEEAE